MLKITPSLGYMSHHAVRLSRNSGSNVLFSLIGISAHIQSSCPPVCGRKLATQRRQRCSELHLEAISVGRVDRCGCDIAGPFSSAAALTSNRCRVFYSTDGVVTATVSTMAARTRGNVRHDRRPRDERTSSILFSLNAKLFHVRLSFSCMEYDITVGIRPRVIRCWSSVPVSTR